MYWNCRFEESSAGHKYEMECMLDKAAKMAYKEPIGCVYMQEGFHRLYLQPNTYTVWYNHDKQKEEGVACKVQLVFFKLTHSFLMQKN